MSKDYITVAKSDGTLEQMEVVATFQLEKSFKNCIIYKNVNENKYYAASYDRDLDLSRLNTDFTDNEKEQLNHIFETLYKEGEMNA